MFEKVNPSHPDKVADRIAGAIVDLAYSIADDPKIAVEVLIGHGHATVIVESSVLGITKQQVAEIVERISGVKNLSFINVPQDVHLAGNQKEKFRCGDNGIFKGVPLTDQQKRLTHFVTSVYKQFPYDGKYIENDNKTVIICQSNVDSNKFQEMVNEKFTDGWKAIVNPLGDWTGGLDVDSGATNRKLGSDMADSVTGGGLHGKDLSKADVSVNIYAFLKAQKTGQEVNLSCAIGDETIDGKPYSEIVEIARNFITALGGFEKFAEYGLVRDLVIK